MNVVGGSGDRSSSSRDAIAWGDVVDEAAGVGGEDGELAGKSRPSCDDYKILDNVLSSWAQCARSRCYALTKPLPRSGAMCT
jgi:hypothetical protein